MEALRAGDPERVGAYRLIARLGGGGMGRVYLGRSRGRRLVAVKVVRPELAGDERFRKRFAAEVAAARRVGGFYTAQVVDADPLGDPPWLVTAYVPGPSLAQAVDAHGALPEATIAVLGAGLAEGLAAVHACDLVHRDLKPGNVILAEDGPRVIDFGIARALDASHHTRSVIGTPPFMSPEQTYVSEIGPASDVFSLGSVLVYAATGHGPFGEGPFEPLIYRIRHDPPDLTGLPVRFTGLVTACLAKAPEGRPTLADILDELADLDEPAGPWLPPAVVTDIAGLRHATRAPDSTGDSAIPPPGPPPAGPLPNLGPGGPPPIPGQAARGPAVGAGAGFGRAGGGVGGAPAAVPGTVRTAGTHPGRTAGAVGATPATRVAGPGEDGAARRTRGFWARHWLETCGAAVLYFAAGALPVMTETWRFKSTGTFAGIVYLVFDPLRPWTEQEPEGISGVSSDWWFPALIGTGVSLLVAVAVVLPLLRGPALAGIGAALSWLSWVWAVAIGLLSISPFITLFGSGKGDDNPTYNIRSLPEIGMYALWLATGLAFHAIHRFRGTAKSPAA